MTGQQLNPTLDSSAAIQKYIEAMIAADDLHILICEGSAGWGKSTAVADGLTKARVEVQHLGSYSTALHLFNFLAEHPDDVILIDDCAAGLFGDSGAMAILKAASWPSQGRRRIV